MTVRDMSNHGEGEDRHPYDALGRHGSLQYPSHEEGEPKQGQRSSRVQDIHEGRMRITAIRNPERARAGPEKHLKSPDSLEAIRP